MYMCVDAVWFVSDAGPSIPFHWRDGLTTNVSVCVCSHHSPCVRLSPKPGTVSFHSIPFHQRNATQHFTPLHSRDECILYSTVFGSGMCARVRACLATMPYRIVPYYFVSFRLISIAFPVKCTTHAFVPSNPLCWGGRVFESLFPRN